jgi:molybdopterin molybdotransferase
MQSMHAAWRKDWLPSRSSRAFSLLIFVSVPVIPFPYHSIMAAEPAGLLSFEEARRTVEDHASLLRPEGRELLGLLDASGRVLAEPIHADRDFPPFPRAARDGYAVRAADLENLPATLEVIGEIKAGAASTQNPEITPGKAAAIMTGAAAPAGTDAVVMVEYTSRAGDRVEISRRVAAGENIVPAGSEAKRGDRLLSPGARISYAEIAVAAAVGRLRLLVYAKPRVAVLSTGDEVVDVDVRPGPNQIRNSNTYSLAAQIHAGGGEAVLLPIAPDEPGRLRELLKEGLESDLLLIAGGVSMGKYDLVEEVLTEVQAEFFFTGAKIQPGKPIVFGRVPCGAGARDSAGDISGSSGVVAQENYKYFLGLPGNPTSTMVTFELFARPMLEALVGTGVRKLIFLHAKLKTAIQTKPGLKRFLPASLTGEFEGAEVELVRWQGSGDIAAVARANCYIVVPPDRERIEAGEWVAVLLR